MIHLHDAAGNQVLVSREDWRTGTLEPMLRAQWDNPDGLYRACVMSLNDGFAGEPILLEAAQRLHAIDNIPERGLTILGIVLSKQRRWASSVHENPPQYDSATNRVNVSFKVEVGPVVTVRAVGAKLSFIPFLANRQMKKLIPIFSEGTVDQDLVDEGQRNLTDYFQKKGYNDVKVTTDYQTKPDQILVVYTIDRGAKHKVDLITFRGNNGISAKELMAQVTVKKSHVWTHGSLSEKLVKQSISNIEALYRDRGYEEVSASAHTVGRSGKTEVNFEITEGPQTIVQNVAVSGNEHIVLEQLTASKGFQLQAGVPFSPRKLANDRNRISATYLDRGYLNADVKATVERQPSDPQHVNITYAITEHQSVRVSEVVYLGQEHTRESLIVKTAHIAPEAPMQRAKLLEMASKCPVHRTLVSEINIQTRLV